MNNEIKNPFYRNHLFSADDLKRAPIRLFKHPWLIFKTTYTQISNGYAFHHKFGGDGRIYFMGAEKLPPIH